MERSYTFMHDFLTAFRITRIAAFACRSPIATPIMTSFGIMRDRPAVFVRIESDDGSFGWGEAFANWPAAGAEHRVNLLVRDIADLVFARRWAGPEALFHGLTRATHIRMLQCGEPGPFRQVIAALDIAAWDMTARRNGVSVSRLLSDNAADSIPAYASGIHIDAAPKAIRRAREAGFTAFKVKIGFDSGQDATKIVALAAAMKPGEMLLTDANQAWDVAQAEAFVSKTRDCGLGWLEEPIAVDAPAADWSRLGAGPVPLAGGENIAGDAEFDAALALGALTYVQPDVAKWGGITGCFSVAQKVIAGGRIYCPHFLGGGIGLAASAHVLAAAGGDGLLEVDVNPNPLRDAFGPITSRISAGRWQVGQAPGLGIETLPKAVMDTVTLYQEKSASDQ